MAPWFLRVLISASLCTGLGLSAVPFFLDGQALDNAIPVPNYMVANRDMSPISYRAASEALALASPADGRAILFRAEAVMRAGNKAPGMTDAVISGLREEPTSSRGWLLLALASIERDRELAARALSFSLLLDRWDFWLAVPRAKIAAALYDSLDQDARAAAQDQVRIIWRQEQLRPSILSLLSRPEGTRLVSKSYDGSIDQLRAINRWVAVQNRKARAQ